MKVKRLKRIIAVLCIGIIFFALIYVDKMERYPLVKEVVKEKEVIVEVEKEVIVEVEKEVEKEVYIEVEPKNHYDVTSEEREMIARLLYREAGGTGLDCQKMVVSVIFNRYDAAKEGTSLSDIVYAKGQFTPASILYRTTPTEENYEAVDFIIKNGSVLPSYVKYFRASYHFNWSGYVGYTSLDNVYFGYVTKDKK